MQRRWIAWPTAALFATASCVTLARAQTQTPTASPPPATAAPQSQAGPGAAPPPPPPSTDQDDDDDDDEDRASGGPTENQIADIVDARVAVLKAELRLTADQARDWPPLQSALHDFGMARAKAMLQKAPPRRGRNGTVGPRNEADRSDDIGRMRAEADVLDQRSAALKKLADAAQPIYANLDERQRKRLVQYIDQGFGGGGRRRH